MSQGAEPRLERIPTERVTSRRKNRPRVSDGSDDENFFPPSSRKRLKNGTDDLTGHIPGSHARRHLDFDGLPREVKKARIKAPAVPHSEEDVVSKLLAAHIRTRNHINAANCFEKQTVLDLISTDSIRQESMADMAIILNSAVEVYGFRVDRCYLHAQDARGHIAATTSKGQTNPLLDANNDTPRKRRRDDIKQNLGDWKARIDEEDERELDDAEEEESDEEEDRHIPEEDTETFLDDIPSNISEMDDFLNTLMHQRRKLNRKLHSHNAHLIEDNDELVDRSNKELSSNEFYQKAVSRYGEGNSTALLMYNAKVSSDSLAYLVHSRVVTKPSKVLDTLNSDYLKNSRALLGNALSSHSKRLENDLLPRLTEVIHESDVDSDEDDGDAMLDMQPNNAEASDSVIPTNNEGKTIRVRTKDFRKSIIFRGKNLLIDRLWIPNDVNLGLPSNDPFSASDKEDFARLLEMRKQNILQVDNYRLPPELDLTNTDLKDRYQYVELAGIDEEVKELDNLWNAQLVSRVVTAEETEEAIRQVETKGGTEEEMLTKKRRILAPGEYVFFMESDLQENTTVPLDTWFEEGAEAVLEVSGGDVFYDAVDDGGDEGFDDLPAAGGDDDIDDMQPMLELDETERPPPDRLADEVRAILEKNPQSLEDGVNQVIPTEDVPDVPVNPGMVLAAPDEAIRNMGKEDAAHWKGNKQSAEPEKEVKKTKKKQVDEKPPPAEDYWAPSNPESRAAALGRFSRYRGVAVIDKTEGSIYLCRPITRAPYAVYDFQRFTKVGSLNGKVEYSGCTWDTSLQTEDLLAKNVDFLQSSLVDDEGRDILGIEYFRALRGIRLYNARREESAERDSDGGGQSDNESTTANDLENVLHDHSYIHMEPDDGPDNADADSFHSANENPWPPENGLPPHRPLPSRKNKVQEIRDLQAADDYEEEGEIAEGLEGKAPIIIKNTSIDQSKVKSYLKSILTNRMMDRKCLKTVAEAAHDRDYLDETVAAVREMTIMNPGQDMTILNRSFEFKSSGIDPLEVSRCVFSAPEELSQPAHIKHKDTNHEGTSQEALRNAVVLSDFNVDGEHSLSSMLACLPFRAQRNNEKNMHVALLFSVALQMCNENTLHCVQDSSSTNADWMGDFVMKNGTSAQLPSTSTAGQQHRSRHAAPRGIPEAIPEDDEEISDSTV